MDRNFLTVTDIDRTELTRLLELGRLLKGGWRPEGGLPLAGRTLLLLFHKPSTRTRISFQVAMFQLGGQAIDLRSQETQINRGETVADTARVFSGYADGVVIRTFAHAELEEWTRWASIPVINGLTNRHHPCQILADLMSIRESLGSLEGKRVVYVGDGNNVLHSWITAACLADFQLVMAVPPEFSPDPTVLAEAAARGYRGPAPLLVHDPREAVVGADVIYTDVWTSMGQEEEHQRRLAIFQPYQVNADLLRRAGGRAKVMHCLPAHHGEEITREAAEGPHSIIFPQAENRLHTQKALLLFLLGGEAVRASLGSLPLPETL
jgi:ornithine carbamoyltransferase